MQPIVATKQELMARLLAGETIQVSNSILIKYMHGEKLYGKMGDFPWMPLHQNFLDTLFTEGSR